MSRDEICECLFDWATHLFLSLLFGVELEEVRRVSCGVGWK